MTHASVFSGIGGPEVAAAMLGWENLFHCEINPFGRAVLEYWFPNATSYEDITTTDFSQWRGKVNILTGGFPCQPFSYAGQRRGEKDDRYLWPYMHRCINQVRPDWVVCENVAGILTMVEQGDVTEMAAEKSLFDEVDTLHRYRLDETFTLERISQDLENDGYAVQAVIIPACAVNAPHRRDRVFIIGRRVSSYTTGDGGDRIATGESGQAARQDGQLDAEPAINGGVLPRTSADPSLMHLNGSQLGDGCDGSRQPQPELGSRDCTATERGIVTHTESQQGGRLRHKQPECGEPQQGELGGGNQQVGRGGFDTNPDNEGLERDASQRVQGHSGRRQQREFCFATGDGSEASDTHAGLGRWDEFPTQSPVHRGNDGIPFPLDNLTISPSKWRTESLKAYGNAIVPQVMYEIFRAIEQTYQQQ